MNKIGNLQGKNVLFLQGPIGFFFKNLDSVFRKRGATTYKVTLNTSDWFFSKKDNTYPFKEHQSKWANFIRTFLEEKQIDKIFLFGDCRFYQSQAIAIAMDLDIEVFVFEEGYVRPYHITMERYGVNNFSKISRDGAFYEALDDSYLKNIPVLPRATVYRVMAWSAVFYYGIFYLFKFMYPHYKHHREPSAVKEGLWWWRNLFRKTKYYLQEKNLLENLIAQHSQKYYFVPLQTYNDFQLLEHSSYASIEIFIEEVLDSFASFAPKDSILVFKHHPADRGRKNYKNFIQNLAKEKGIEEKVLVIYDLHLPTLLENARATITINSTVGLSSLAHQTPTLTLGDAIYDIEGITSKGMPLDKFWTDFKKPNKKLFNKFRNYLIKTTQLNGSFYGNFPLEFESDEMYL